MSKLFLLLISGLLLLSYGFQMHNSTDRLSDEKLPKENVNGKIILTPKPGPAPQINGPRLFGVRPGRPFIYRIPCTGKRPMTFKVEDLPEGMRLNANTGIIRGDAPNKPGKYIVKLMAENDIGAAEKEFSIVVGEQLALTPPMGWNSWYIHLNRVTDKVMRKAADVMVESGMADYGYMYVSIDDCWMKIEPEYYEERKKSLHGVDKNSIVGDLRDQQGNILCNANFPDMKGLTDYIHTMGLRAGIYSSPGSRTCQRYSGSYKHELQDAKQYADWGFDFLKYDWCRYGEVFDERMKEGKNKLAELKMPFQQMSEILKSLDRDIVYNLCQYGMGDVWEWGGDVGHSWRTTGDLGLVSGDRLPGFYHIGMNNARLWEYAGPGEWNDPDYLLLGWIDALGSGISKETSLNEHEQYSYMSMWSLMAAPLFFSGDMAKLDDFTINILCNPEVIDINQDALGKQARIVKQNKKMLILSKPLEDGSIALGLFNIAEKLRNISVNWDMLGISGPQRVRDVWRNKDLDEVNKQYSVEVARHGVMLVRLWPSEK